MREPDSIDSARVLALALLAIGVALLLGMLGVPRALVGIFQQAAFFAIPLVYARWNGLRAFAANGYVPIPLRRIALVVVASLGTLWLLNGLTHLQTKAIRSAGYEKQAVKEEEQIRQGIERAQDQGALPALSLLVL